MNIAGQFFFRTRNWLFSLVLVCMLAIFPPRLLGDRVGTWLMIAGAIMLLIGQTARILTIGLDYIKRGGKDGRVYAERLVTGGVYAHCRNPMYVGNLAILLGYFLLWGNMLALAIGGGFFIFAYLAITLTEETFLRGKFGEEYEEFCRRSPRFLPSPHHLRGLLSTVQSYQFDWPAVIVKEYGTLFVTIVVSIGILAWKAQRSGELARLWPIFAAGMASAVVYWAFARWLKKGKGLRPHGVRLIDKGVESDDQSINTHRAGALDPVLAAAKHEG